MKFYGTSLRVKSAVPTKNMDKLIAIVDDEQDIRELVAINLKKAGYKVKEYEDADSLLKVLPRSIPDLIILDIMMPGTDGIQACKIIKSSEKTSRIPIIMLTAKADESDKIVGLETGADDYVTKPFSPRELTARVKAVLRRGSKEQGSMLKAGAITIDLEKHEVRTALKAKGKAEDKVVELTATEFKILEILISGKGKVLSREQLLDNLWGGEKFVIDRTIDVHVKHLRTKLGDAGKTIKNIRGVGYKIET
jgi:DNA-binding response OmpR family regulator